KKKGYELIHCMSYGPNAFFVDARYYDRFGISDNSPEAMFTMWKLSPESPPAFPDEKQALRIDAFEIEKKLRTDR
ncbi:MAG: hypothetical protein ABFS46_00250, partial [Myxococcota bacterium]